MERSNDKDSLKILVDTKRQKVLFAEAGKEFVDFLFHILSLPIGTVVRVLTKHGMVGCLGNLYASVENLSQTYIQTKRKIISSDFFMCPSYHRNVTDKSTAVCPQYRRCMTVKIPFVDPHDDDDDDEADRDHHRNLNGGGDGFVRELVTYMIMDDLVVEPMSTISGIVLLNKFNIKDVGVLEERVVDITMSEGLKLLQASLQSKTVLTSVFLNNAGNI